mmetsp:Transcript_38968/g.72491  ORF Transcript_38968/g.72491 Transcript_38968/m.72491 type:complete len:531 (-) Transcript_38968:76-1668(-)
MDKLTKFVKEQSLQRTENTHRPEELVQWLLELGSRGEQAAADFGYANTAGSMVHDRNDEVATAAITALGDMGQEGMKYMRQIASGLARSPQVCTAAATALAQFGKQAAEYESDLALCLERVTDEAAKAAVIVALGAIGAEGEAAALAKYLDDKSAAVSAAACQALGHLPSKGLEEAPRIAKKLQDPSTRFGAVSALGKLGGGSVEKYIPEIAECLKDKDSLTRQAAANTLAAAADAVLKSTSGASFIAGLLKDAAPGVRCAAALSLGKLGPRASSYAPDIAKLLADGAQDDSESYLAVGGGSLRSAAIFRRPKCAALAALSLMNASNYAADMAMCLRDKSYEVRLCALESLMQMGDAGKKQSTNIMAAMEDDVYIVRLKSCQAIAALQAQDVMDNLPDLFKDEAPSVREASLEALATCPEIAKKYCSQIFKCLEDEYGTVRAAAMRALSSMDSIGQGYASAIAGELTHQDPHARAAACETLGKFGDYGAAFAEEIESCQSDEVPVVRAAATQALAQLGVARVRGIENGAA